MDIGREIRERARALYAKGNWRGAVAVLEEMEERVDALWRVCVWYDIAEKEPPEELKEELYQAVQEFVRRANDE